MRLRALITAGMVAPALFAGLTLAQVPFKSGYSLSRDLISHLALGPGGWVQSANFVVSGGLLIAFSSGLRRVVSQGPGHRWGPRWVFVTGVALVGAGLFPIDPGPSFPVGFTPERTWHGTLHSVAGPAMFLGLTMTAATFSRRFARPVGMAVTVAVPTALTIASVMTALDWSGTWGDAPAGLFESIAAYSGMAWIFIVAAHERTSVDPTPSDSSPNAGE